MRNKLVWLAIFVAAATALALTNCRGFPDPTEPTLPSGNSLEAPAFDWVRGFS